MDKYKEKDGDGDAVARKSAGGDDIAVESPTGLRDGRYLPKGRPIEGTKFFEYCLESHAIEG